MTLRVPRFTVSVLVACVQLLTASAFTLQEVDPFIGTGQAGNCYPGAQAPFGMISWSPNTTFADYGSVPSRPGYKYDRDQIYGFTVPHLSGVGCHGAQDLPIMPVRGALNDSPVLQRETYASRFSHARERAHPGYYQVYLDDAQTDVAITVTARAGLGRFTFASGAVRSILFRPTQSANGIVAAELSIDPELGRVTGMVASGGFCNRDPKLYDYRL